jgi:hypothetical protein
LVYSFRFGMLHHGNPGWKKWQSDGTSFYRLCRTVPAAEASASTWSKFYETQFRPIRR